VLANIARQTMAPMLGNQAGKPVQPVAAPSGPEGRQARARRGSAPGAGPDATSAGTSPEPPDGR
jgi:hypothetical protein